MSTRSITRRRRRSAPFLAAMAVSLVYLLGASAGQAAAAPAAALAVTGNWDATVGVGVLQIPFRFGLAVHGTQATGWFFNGEEQIASTSGTFKDGRLNLEFSSYGRRLEATLGADGALSGAYVPTTGVASAQPYPFHALHAPDRNPAAGNPAPSIAGQWLVPAPSQKAGEQAWRLIVHQQGAQVSAAILRVDGDTGALTGSWRDDRLVLSHFDGARPALIEVSPGPQNTLQLLLRSTRGTDSTLTAYRTDDARARGLPEAADPARHTTMKDAQEPFTFSFPDLSGKIVSSTDARFRGKVLLVDIAGSWCPNCHDEAPFLQQLYRKYHDRGLEIVTLSFEEPEQLANPTRLRAFVKDFGLTYTVLLAGSTDQLHDKVPQAVGLDAYPTTFFIGRDGRVRGTHAGFAAAATGDFNTQLKKAFSASVEQLLAEVVPGKPNR